MLFCNMRTNTIAHFCPIAPKAENLKIVFGEALFFQPQIKSGAASNFPVFFSMFIAIIMYMINREQFENIFPAWRTIALIAIGGHHFSFNSNMVLLALTLILMPISSLPFIYPHKANPTTALFVLLEQTMATVAKSLITFFRNLLFMVSFSAFALLFLEPSKIPGSFKAFFRAIFLWNTPVIWFVFFVTNLTQTFRNISNTPWTPELLWLPPLYTLKKLPALTTLKKVQATHCYWFCLNACPLGQIQKIVCAFAVMAAMRFLCAKTIIPELLHKIHKWGQPSSVVVT